MRHEVVVLSGKILELGLFLKKGGEQKGETLMGKPF